MLVQARHASSSKCRDLRIEAAHSRLLAQPHSAGLPQMSSRIALQ